MVLDLAPGDGQPGHPSERRMSFRCQRSTVSTVSTVSTCTKWTPTWRSLLVLSWKVREWPVAGRPQRAMLHSRYYTRSLNVHTCTYIHIMPMSVQIGLCRRDLRLGDILSSFIRVVVTVKLADALFTAPWVHKRANTSIVRRDEPRYNASRTSACSLTFRSSRPLADHKPEIRRSVLRRPPFFGSIYQNFVRRPSCTVPTTAHRGRAECMTLSESSFDARYLPNYIPKVLFASFRLRSASPSPFFCSLATARDPTLAACSWLLASRGLAVARLPWRLACQAVYAWPQPF